MTCILKLGYSNGQPRDANNPSINSGGQCTDGLKMVVLLGVVTNPTPGMRIYILLMFPNLTWHFFIAIGENRPNEDTNSNSSANANSKSKSIKSQFIYPIAGGVGGFILLTIITMVVVCLCCIYTTEKKHVSKSLW